MLDLKTLKSALLQLEEERKIPRDKIIDAIIDKAGAEDEWNKLKNYLFYVDAVVVGTLAVELAMMVCVKCYIGSLRERNNDYDYKFVDDEGNKLTVGQKN